MPIKSGMENVKMTTVGRGRGWSANVDPGVLRRPGELLLPVADTDMESLMSAVQALNLQEPSASVSTLRNFDEQLRALCMSADMLRNLVHRLHDRSLEDRQFGKKAATACGFANTFEVDDVKMRALFLTATQKDYEEYAQLQTSNNAKFLNSVALLGEIFHRVRLNDGSPISVLATPIMHYQDILLSGEEHEMELFTTLLSVNGRKLLECCPSELEELLLRVRSVLMSRNLSEQCRCWLLLALDLAANRFGPLPAVLQGFYQVHLGSTALSQLQRIDAGLTVETGSSPFSHSLLQTRPSEPPPLHSPRSPLTRANSVPNKTPPASVTNKSPPSSVTNKIPFPSVPNKTLVTTKPPPEEEVQVVANNVEHRSKHNSEEKIGFRIGRSGRSNSFKSPTEKTGKKFTFTTDGSSDGSREEPGSWRSEAGRGKEPSADEKWGGSKSQGWGHDDRFEKDESIYGKQEPRTGIKGGGSSRGGGGDAPKFTRLSSSGSGGGNFKGRNRQPPAGAKPKNDIPPNFDVIPPSSTEQENWDRVEDFVISFLKFKEQNIGIEVVGHVVMNLHG